MQLFGLEVHCGRAVVGPPLPAERAGRKQHRLGQLGFAGRTLTDDRDASQTSDFLHSHGVCSWGSFLVFVWPLRVMLWRAQCSGNAPAMFRQCPGPKGLAMAAIPAGADARNTSCPTSIVRPLNTHVTRQNADDSPPGLQQQGAVRTDSPDRSAYTARAVD